MIAVILRTLRTAINCYFQESSYIEGYDENRIKEKEDRRMKTKYYCKLILFGEYSMVLDSTAIVIPLRSFSASWEKASSVNVPEAEFSIGHLLSFRSYLTDDEITSAVIDTDRMLNDLNEGWYLKSDIPSGCGLGSSGMVVAAVYDKYSFIKSDDPQELKKLFARMENYFHGSSSGIDPLQCYLSRPFMITSDTIRFLPEDFLHQSLSVCLIDTKIKRNTKPLVEYFKRECQNEAYMKTFQNEYLPNLADCIDSLLNKDIDSFFPELNRLSNYQLQLFRPMIPDIVSELFSCDPGFHFGAKILGAGGGGYMLAFTDETERARSLLSSYDVVLLPKTTADILQNIQDQSSAL